MIAPALKLQNDLQNLMATFAAMRNEALDLYNVYWKGGVTGDISGLSDGDPACSGARLTKAELNQGLTLVDQVGNIFFEGAAVTTGDYMATCELSLYGNATPTLVSQAVEGYANRLVVFCNQSIIQYKNCRNTENFYGAVLFSAISGLPNGTDIPTGADMTRDDFLAAIALVHQWQSFLQNSAVTTDFYRTTLGLWARIG